MRNHYFFDNDDYSIGEYCRTIEGFMIGFSKTSTIMDDEDILPFKSNKDLLNRCMEFDNDAISAAIYIVDGTLIDKVNRLKSKTVNR